MAVIWSLFLRVLVISGIKNKFDGAVGSEKEKSEFYN
jgi:hypothetical protein